MNASVLPLALIYSLFAMASAVRSDEIAPCPDGLSFVVSGDINHYQPNTATTDIPPGASAHTFEDEIFGHHLVALVNGLPEGDYTAQIDLAESYHDQEGQRLLSIKCGAQVLADKLDIFKLADGRNKAYRLTSKIHHFSDQKEGGLALVFDGQVGDAKFNAIRVLNSAGHVVACITAADAAQADNLADLAVPTVKDPPIYQDANQPTDTRIDDLIRRMSLREKVGQMMSHAAGIPRLHILPYSYVNEGLHGVVTGGTTMFPQAICNAATFDVPLVGHMAESISEEARAKFAEAQSHQEYGDNHGLSFWSPNVNIFRDPRWGRGQETYGEDPFLTSAMGVAFVRGMQGDDPHYYRAAACAKHFAVHSGPEPGRGGFNVDPDERDLRDTYLPQFQALVQKGRVGAVMSSYNALDYTPASCNPWLLTELLRKDWGFRGQVVSDCGAIQNITNDHHYVATNEQAVADAVKAGCDLECGTAYAALPKAVRQGLILVRDLDEAVRRNLRLRFELGMFDPPERVPYTRIGMDVVESPAHLAQATRLAHEGIVLLRNEKNTLPLDVTHLRRLAVIGGNADSTDVLGGDPWYRSTPSHQVTILQGIKAAVGSEVQVVEAKGCPLWLKQGEVYNEQSPGFAEAVDAARGSDVVIYVGGIIGGIEGEERDINLVGFFDGDRTSIELPEQQTQLIQALQATGKPVVFVNCSGSAMAFPWEAEHLSAIVQAWYPGMNGGTAVADVLFGKYNPSGRLPVTFYRSTQDLPRYQSYRMTNRTYRYFTGKPLYAFGYGLSYTKFDYGTPSVDTNLADAKGSFHLRVPVTNTGSTDGDEVVQVYARAPLNSTLPPDRVPVRSLVGFQRAPVGRGATVNFELNIPVECLQHWSVEKQKYVVDPGSYEFQVAAASNDVRQKLPVSVR